MSVQAIIRAFCVDGPLVGVQYLDVDSGAVIFVDHPDIAECYYKLDPSRTVRTEAGSHPVAHFTSLVRHDGTQLFR